jgi:hypothetical protein
LEYVAILFREYGLQFSHHQQLGKSKVLEEKKQDNPKKAIYFLNCEIFLRLNRVKMLSAESKCCLILNRFLGILS